MIQINQKLLNLYKQSKRLSQDLQYFTAQFQNFKVSQAAMMNTKNVRVDVIALVGRTVFSYQNRQFPICLGIYIPHEYPTLQPRVLVIPEGNQIIHISNNVTDKGVVIDFKGWSQQNNIIFKVQKCLDLFTLIPPVKANNIAQHNPTNIESMTYPMKQQQPQSQQQNTTQNTFSGSYIPQNTSNNPVNINFKQKVAQIISIYQNQIESQRLIVRNEVEKLKNENSVLSQTIESKLNSINLQKNNNDSEFVFGTKQEELIQSIINNNKTNSNVQKKACQVASDELLEKLVNMPELQTQELLMLLNIDDLQIREMK